MFRILTSADIFQQLFSLLVGGKSTLDVKENSTKVCNKKTQNYQKEQEFFFSEKYILTL